MSAMTKEGFGALKFAYLVLGAGIGVAIFLVSGSYLLWQAEKGSSLQAQRRLNDVQARLANAKQQREDLRNSEDTYKALVSRGVFVPESRLDLLDAMEVLKRRHYITALEYELGVQRPLRLAGGTTMSAVNAMGSRFRVKASAIHDGDMLAFLDEFARMQRGVFPAERCALTRNPRAIAAAAAAAMSTPPVGSLTGGTAGDAAGDSRRGEGGAPALVSAIDADCSFEWITLVDKPAAPVAASAGNSAAQPAKAR